MGGGKDDAPDPPDYAGAAAATAQGNADAARIAAKANRVSQYTPYGSLVYTNNINNDPDLWRADVTLSPNQQYLLNAQDKTSMGLADLQNQGLQYVKNMLDKPFDQSKLPAEQIAAGQTAQDAIMQRLDPKFKQSEDMMRTRLANQGIAPGTEAWNNEMRTFNEAKNDAYTQAALQGMGFGQQARQQAVQEQAFLRNEPLNTLNAVRTGAQVTNPQFSAVPQQATTSGPDMLGASQMQYQADLNNYNANAAAGSRMKSGLMALGGTALGAYLGGPQGAAAGSQIGSNIGSSM